MRRRLVDLLTIVMAVALIGCGGREARVETAPPRPDTTAVDSTSRSESRSGVTGEPEGRAATGSAVAARDPGAGTPARAASERLVAEGEEAADAGRVEEAARTLERAIRIDPSHGDAYLRLAGVRARQGREREAIGLLDRAVDLLRPYPDRRAEAIGLRERLSAG